MTNQEEVRDIIDGVAIGEIKPAQALYLLSDLGVVIKVDGDIYDEFYIEANREEVREYVKVEPLIKEQK